MAKKTRSARLGKKATHVEELFAELPPVHRKMPVLTALAKAAGITGDALESRFRMAKAMLTAAEVGQ